MNAKAAFRIRELVAAGPLRRSALYKALQLGHLRAYKYGRATIVLAGDWQRFLASLPQRKRSPAQVKTIMDEHDPYGL
mgnify:CR=1 FL=1